MTSQMIAQCTYLNKINKFQNFTSQQQNELSRWKLDQNVSCYFLCDHSFCNWNVRLLYLLNLLRFWRENTFDLGISFINYNSYILNKYIVGLENFASRTDQNQRSVSKIQISRGIYSKFLSPLFTNPKRHKTQILSFNRITLQILIKSALISQT